MGNETTTTTATTSTSTFGNLYGFCDSGDASKLKSKDENIFTKAWIVAKSGFCMAWEYPHLALGMTISNYVYGMVYESAGGITSGLGKVAIQSVVDSARTVSNEKQRILIMEYAKGGPM